MPLIICPDCSSQVSDAAPACPKCGRPLRQAQPVAVYVKPKTSLFGWIFLGTASLCIVTSMVNYVRRQMETPEEVRARNVADQYHGPPAAPASSTLQKIAAMTPADDAKRDKLIQQQLNLGTIGDIEYRQTGAEMQVGTPFALLDIKDKRTMAAVVWISAVRRAKSPGAFFILTLSDRRTGKTVGTYCDELGLELK